MDFATGSETQLSYWPEEDYGVTPDTPTIKTFRGTMGGNFKFTRDTFSSNEISETQQEVAYSYGTKQGAVSLPFDFSYGSFDDFLEALLGGKWESNKLKCGKIKRSFGFEDDISEVGIHEQNLGTVFTGMDLSVQENAVVSGTFSGLFRDQRVAQTLDVDLDFDGTANTITRSTGSWADDGFVVGDTPVVTGASDEGNNVASFAITELTDTVMTLGDASGMVTASSESGVAVNLGSIGAATAPNSNDPFNSFKGTIAEGKRTLAYISGLDLKLVREAEAKFVILKNDADLAQGVTRSKFVLTGTLTAYLTDQAFKKKFLNGTPSTLKFTLGDGASKSYLFDMRRVYFSSNDRDRQANDIIETIEFQAIYDPEDASTLTVTRIP